ncbi:hypothetical protein [Lysinibacillus sp. 54212]|uniref:hypothetical protein n=1 Tax=Lysinibacillus sp. 54212 TaxID=3119829 RepID=UPI002FCC79D0
MKKHYLFITTILCAMLFVTACNETEEPVSENDPVEDNSAQTPNKENEESDGEVSNDAESNEEQVNDDQQSTNEQQTNNEQQTTITYPKNGKEVTTETAAITSESQHYKMMITKDFTLTAEEPGRDMLIYKQNDKRSMRIETFNKKDTNYEDFVKETEETISLIAPEGKYEPGDVTPYVKSNSIENAAMFTVKYEEDGEQVVTAVFEKEDRIVRLSVFDSLQPELTNAFLQMGFTIQ